MLRLLERLPLGVIEKNLFLGVSCGLLSLPNLARVNMSQAQLFTPIAPYGTGDAYRNGMSISTTPAEQIKGTHDNLIECSLSR